MRRWRTKDEQRDVMPASAISVARAARAARCGASRGSTGCTSAAPGEPRSASNPRPPKALPGASRLPARAPAGSRAPPTDPPPLDRQARLEAFAAFPRRLEAVARSAAERPTVAGEWGPSEVVRHLVAVEREVLQARLRASRQSRTTRTGAGRAGPRARPRGRSRSNAVLARFAARPARRRPTVRALDDAGWATLGDACDYGVLDVAGLLDLAIDHDEAHLEGLPAEG